MKPITITVLCAATGLAILATLLTLSSGGCGILYPTPLPQPTPTPPPTTDLAREIEEADIVKLQDGYLYISNPYRGLRIIDVTNIDQPALLGGLSLAGRGVELFVRDNLAFMITSADFFTCAGSAVGYDAAEYDAIARPDYTGSRLSIIDITDKSNPQLASQWGVEGFVTTTRRVGDVLYLAGDLLPDATTSGESAFVASLNIADPANITTAGEASFSGESLFVYTGPQAMYLVGEDPTMPDTTLVTYVDISDPAGAVVVRDQFRVPGSIQSRYFIDEHEGQFRIITEEYVENTYHSTVALYVYDVSNPDDVSRVARLPIVTDETLWSVRFDGNRAYATTYTSSDPLYVLDLTDSAAPQVAGQVAVPGYSTYLVPLGDRLLGLGFDDSNGIRPALALYDVADPADPHQLSRLVLGTGGDLTVGSEAFADERAVQVIESAGFVLLPYSVFDEEVGQFTDLLQIVSLSSDQLAAEGQVEHRGLLRRCGLLEDHVWLLSDLAFQVVNVDQPEEPVSLAGIELMSEQDLLDAGLTGCADSARYAGMPLYFYDYYPSYACGAFDPVMFAATGGLLLVASLVRRRR